MKRVALTILTVVAASPAFAGVDVIVAAPEIDAVSGLAALGIVGTFAAVVWERRG